MTIELTDYIAHVIRTNDVGNRLTATEVGSAIAERLTPFYSDLPAADVIAFVEHTNRTSG